MKRRKSQFSGLVADVGGTHVRFALVGGDGLDTPKKLLGDDYPSLGRAAKAYLAEIDGKPRAAAFAVPCPVDGDRIVPTNRPEWAFSIAELQDELELERLEVLNDFEAQALALPDLEEGGVTVVHPAEGDAGAPRGVLGPGTGLGVAGLVELGGHRIALAGEGGHRDFAAASEREWQVFEALSDLYGHVSCERVVSGPGLADLHRVLRRLDGRKEIEIRPSEVVARAREGHPHAREAVDIFCAQLGAVSGDLALTLGARGGIFLAGGVLGKLGEAFRRDAFLERYLGKGRFREYLIDIPVVRVDHPHPGLLGAAWVLKNGTGRSSH